MGEQAVARGLAQSARSYFQRAGEAGSQAALVRKAVTHAAETTLQMLSDSESVESDRRGLG
jgi:hypothetical protein